MMTPSDMSGKAALVTGAASGLGRATAMTLARAGADLLLVDVNPAGLAEAAGEACALGVRAVAHVTDLAKPENCKGAVAAALEAFGRLDALCNIAGVLVMTNAAEMSTADYERTIAINLNAPFHLSQAAIPHLLEVDGAIVNVTSSAAFLGEAYCVAYCASKAGLTHMTKSLAMEFMKKPIRINAVAPGGMMTNISAGFKMPEGADYSLIERFTGIRGVNEVDDVAAVVAFLASPAAVGFHGACINIDKGITAG